MTTSYADVQDLYLEQVRADTVRRGAAYEPLVLRTEDIRVRGEDQPRALRIRSSQHGPLLSDVSDELQQVGVQQARPGSEGYAVAVSWLGGGLTFALAAAFRGVRRASIRVSLRLRSAGGANTFLRTGHVWFLFQDG